MVTTQDTDPTGAALALLPLSEPEALSEPQLSGRACVWCRVPLSNDTAVDLGQRGTDAHGSKVSWFPRSCHTCMGPRARQTAQHHARTCEQCVDDTASTNKSVCDTARRLRRLMLEHTR